MDKLYIGVDMALASFESARGNQQERYDLGGFSNDEAGHQDLVKAVEKLNFAGQIHLIIEPTGGYELALVTVAHEQGWLVSLPNPKQVRDWAKGMGYRVKTDKVDARMLAHYGAVCQPKAHQSLPEALQDLDDLLKRQQDLEKLIRQERNRQHALSVRPQVESQTWQSIQDTLAFLQQQLDLIQQAIKAFFKAHPTYHTELKRLRQVPGIGPKNAPFILLLLYRWDCLTASSGSAKQLTAFVGLDPQQHSSGSSVYKRPSISKMGNSQLRSLLYMGALGASRGHNPLRDFYQGLVQRGKSKKLALVAGARKILTWAWAVFRNKVDFDPYRINPNFSKIPRLS